jgi:yecA family protein
MIPDKDLNEDALVELSHFIEDNGHVSPTGAVGLLAAVASAPEEVAPGEWLGALWGDPEFNDEQHAARILNSVVMLHDAVEELLDDADLRFVPGADAPAKVEEFCRGYLRGVQLAPEWKRDSRAMILPSILSVLAAETPPSAALTKPVSDVAAWLADHRRRLRDYIAALHERFAGRLH